MDAEPDTLRIDLPDLPCRIGIAPGENDSPQPVRVSVTLEVSLDAVLRSGRLEDSVDYAPIHSALVEAVCGRQWELIESLAGELLERALRPEAVRAAVIRVTKLSPPLGPASGPVTVELRRARP
jgi:dihydroneopterin aldolase